MLSLIQLQNLKTNQRVNDIHKAVKWHRRCDTSGDSTSTAIWCADFWAAQ